MRRIRGYIICFAVLVVSTMLFTAAVQAAVTIAHVQTTDVSPAGFSVIWQSSEPAEARISIYSDAAGVTEITTDFELTFYPVHSGDPDSVQEYQKTLDKDAIVDAAKALGLVKIAVHGCMPETTYYFKVHAEAGGETADWPETAPAAVTTATENSFVAESRQLLLTFFNGEGNLDASGWLVTASSAGTRSPICEFVGDGAGFNQVYLNLSRLFAADGLNWSPAGNQDIEIQVLGADSGPVSRVVMVDFSSTFSVAALDAFDISIGTAVDSDGDGLFDDIEAQGCTDSQDADTDDDGIADGDEDVNHNGLTDTNETDPCKADTDGDGLGDGLELGVTVAVADPDGAGPLLGTDLSVFRSDDDPDTTTDPLVRDSDGDGAWDGVEDIDRDGNFEAGETDPNDELSYPPLLISLKKGYNQIALPVDVSALPDLEAWLPVFGGAAKTEKVMAYDPATGTYVTLVPGSAANPTFTLTGGEGLIVYQVQEHQVAIFTMDCSSRTLQAGTNLVGYACPAPGLTAFDWLSTLGSDNVYSIQRYAVETGRFETAGFTESGNPSGIDFSIVAGEGYFIYKK